MERKTLRTGWHVKGELQCTWICAERVAEVYCRILLLLDQLQTVNRKQMQQATMSRAVPEVLSPHLVGNRRPSGITPCRCCSAALQQQHHQQQHLRPQQPQQQQHHQQCSRWQLGSLPRTAGGISRRQLVIRAAGAAGGMGGHGGGRGEPVSCCLQAGGDCIIGSTFVGSS